LETNSHLTRSELIDALASRGELSLQDIEIAVKALLQHMAGSLAHGERIEIRGFGSFSLHTLPPRTGRNPRTGESVKLPTRHSTHFKPGKELKELVNASKSSSTDQ
jgi:integration host factor subunit beta